MLDWRSKAFNDIEVLKEPNWQNQNIQKLTIKIYILLFSSKSMKGKPKSLDEVDPKLIETYNKAWDTVKYAKRLSGVAVDAVFDSFMLQLSKVIG